jgi:hypothetical protein
MALLARSAWLLAALGPGVGASPQQPDGSAAAVELMVGASFPDMIAPRVRRLLQLAGGGGGGGGGGGTGPGRVLSCGATRVAADCVFAGVTPAERVGPEGFLLAARECNGTKVIAAIGRPPAVAELGVDGSVPGCYAALERLGFAFLHPLAPSVPRALDFDFDRAFHALARPVDGARSGHGAQPDEVVAETPHFPMRGWHIHTEHPLELTDLLQGMGSDTPHRAGAETWASMLPEWQLVVEWAVANRQNHLEWVLLAAADWADYAYSAVRQARLTQLTRVCAGYGLPCGLDFGIAIKQQHAAFLVNTTASQPGDFRSLHARLDWMAAAGFSYLSTESGTSELTHPPDSYMLSLINETTRYAAEVHGMPAYIKVHCSSDQVAKDYKDPRTGQPINFNFLPIFADERLGMMPHPVQLYSHNDPAPTYGNVNFSYLFDFMFDFAEEADRADGDQQQQRQGRRMVYHPETAYWVSYDINVPLFLPVYGYNRLRDLRYIDRRQRESGRKIHGQMMFDSGWEFGYWLHDVVAARGAWDDPQQPNSLAAGFIKGLAPFTNLLGPEVGAAFGSFMVDFVESQRKLLINPLGLPAAEVVELNGIGYLQGWDAFADLESIAASLGFSSAATQPRRLGLRQLVLFPELHSRKYFERIRPILVAMDGSFGAAAATLARMLQPVPADSPARRLCDELCDSIELLHLRASQLLGLYDYATGGAKSQANATWRASRLVKATASINAAHVVMQRRVANFRTPTERVAAWAPGPTAYQYRYLWSAMTLYYWVRDHRIATARPTSAANTMATAAATTANGTTTALSPCFLNIIDPYDVVLGEGLPIPALKLLRQIADAMNWSSGFIIDCLAAPVSAPALEFPSGGDDASSGTRATAGGRLKMDDEALELACSSGGATSCTAVGLGQTLELSIDFGRAYSSAVPTGVKAWAFVNGTQWGAPVTAPATRLLLPMPRVGAAQIVVALLPLVAFPGPAGLPTRSPGGFPVGTPLSEVEPWNGTVSNAVSAVVQPRRIAPPAPRRPSEPLVLLEWESEFSAHYNTWISREATPLCGLYSSYNTDVHRQHALWLVEAGVDAVLLDWVDTLFNVPSWEELSAHGSEDMDASVALVATWAQMRKEGLPTPQVVPLLGLDNSCAVIGKTQCSAKVDVLQRQIEWTATTLRESSFSSLLREHGGQLPLLGIFDTTGLAMNGTYPEQDKLNTTGWSVKWMSAFLDTRPTQAAAGYWSWSDGSPRPVRSGTPTDVEAVCVKPAYFPQGPAKGHYIPPGGWRNAQATPQHQGATLLMQMQAAMLAPRPRYVIVSQWNEFTQDGCWPDRRQSIADSEGHAFSGAACNATLSDDIEPTSLTECGDVKHGDTCGGWGFSALNYLRAAIWAGLRNYSDSVNGHEDSHPCVLAILQPDDESKFAAGTARINVKWRTLAASAETNFSTHVDGVRHHCNVSRGNDESSCEVDVSHLQSGEHVLTVTAAQGAWTRLDVSRDNFQPFSEAVLVPSASVHIHLKTDDAVTPAPNQQIDMDLTLKKYLGVLVTKLETQMQEVKNENAALRRRVGFLENKVHILSNQTKKDIRRINMRLDQCEADTFAQMVERRQTQEQTPACDREAVA